MSSAAQEAPTPIKPNEKGDQFPTGPEAIAFALGELTGKVNNLRTDIKDWKDGAKSTAADHEDRLRIIEKWHVKITALTGAAGTILGFIVQWAVHNVHL